METNKIKNSKCPHCKKYGLPFYKTSYKYNPIIICKYCGKKFKVNRALSLTALILLAIFMGVGIRIINENIFDIPMWVCYFLYVALWLAFQYFAPLEECIEEDN